MFIDLKDVVLQKTLPVKEFQTKGRKCATVRVQVGVFTDKSDCRYFVSFYDEDIDLLNRDLNCYSPVMFRVWLNGRSNEDFSFTYHSLTFDSFI